MNLGEILVARGWLGRTQLEAALDRQSRLTPRPRLGELLIRDALITESQLAAALAEQLDLPFLAEIPETSLDAALIARLPVDWARLHGLLPLRVDGRLSVALATPEALTRLNELSLLVGADLSPVVVSATTLRGAMDATYLKGAPAPAAAKAADTDDVMPEPRSNDLLRGGDQAPAIQLVNRMLLDAVRQRASDIHIEPFKGRLVVRFRVDGQLYEQPSPPKNMEASLVSRLKIMGRLDIAERRLPQDGMASVNIGERAIDIRLSTLPVAEGERVVLRLLNRDATVRSLQELGMPAQTGDALRKVIREPNGIILVTGPTGSGKTTTLYAALREVDTRHLNVMTIEDPIEYQLDGIGQMQVKPKIGLTFAQGLRHILRQDPDVVLVGEIRDSETAEIAVRASLTGHLVFATLHTNDAASAVIRLQDMGVEPYLLSAALRGVLAQRLVRTVCPDCAAQEPREASTTAPWGFLAGRLNDAHVPRAVGCAQCIGGYRGRTGLYEWMAVDDAIRELIRDGSTARAIHRAAVERGMRTLVDDGVQRIRDGITTPTEVLRVLGTSL